jgi:hypothetical protein
MSAIAVNTSSRYAAVLACAVEAVDSASPRASATVATTIATIASPRANHPVSSARHQG